MAYYAALVSLVQLLEEIIHRDRYLNLLLDKKQISYVHERFSLLQTLLDDYSPKDRERAYPLERRIRDAAYQVQDIIESHISNQVPQYLSQKNQKPLPLHELEEVKEEVDSIVEELMIRIKESHTTEDNLRLKYYSADAGASNQASRTNTTVGLEEHLTTIKGELCGERSKLQVVSIVGMGGIGKTTIARNIFDDGFMKYHFDCRFWVIISQDYNLKRVLLDILDCMNVAVDKSSEVAELGTKIYKHLTGRRYLIVLDDMWDTKVWDSMKSILPNDSNGSRIMITTRISDVAHYADRFGFYYQMELLNEEQSWNLFREKVFCPPELEDIGRLISKNCRGLPLAIVVVAGLLTKVNKARCDWEEIARNVSSKAAGNDEHFSKILSLSYNHLPHHLKPCLLYIGGFPEDYEIRVSKLIKLWVAEGFLKPIEFKSLEAVAEEYLEDLVNRNLILITMRKFNGKIKCCSIHDLLRDLCMKKISDESFMHTNNFHSTVTRNVRRLYIRDYFLYQPQFPQECCSNVRSIIDDTYSWNSLLELGSKLLRVLDAPKVRLDRFPTNILEFFHLRFLAFYNNVIPIPPSISQLQNLQTLIIESEASEPIFCSLPSQIWEMPKLRHIMSTNKMVLKCPIFNERIVGKLSVLENLQTISRVADVRFTEEVIEMIPNLQKLKLFYYVEYAVWQTCCLDNLFHLRQLESLNIDFLDSYKREVNSLPMSFAFPLTLKNLSLSCSKIPWKDMTLVGSLPNLQVLKLRKEAFVGENWEPVEGEFPQLKFLLMERLDLKNWQAEDTHFPTLEHLKISFCWDLQRIPPEIGEISTLELIEVGHSKLAAKSALQIQEEQQDNGNDVLQVQVYPQPRNFRKEKASKGDEEIQEEASKSEEKIQEEASESEEELPEEEGLEINLEEIQMLNTIRDDIMRRAHRRKLWKLLLGKCFCFQ